MKSNAKTEKDRFVDLAMNSWKTKWLPETREILMIPGIAYYISFHIQHNGFRGPFEKEFLMLPGVAMNLVTRTFFTTQDEDILMLPGVAEKMAFHSGATGWTTNNKKILMLDGVAWRLSVYSKKGGWHTTDLDILMLGDDRRSIDTVSFGKGYENLYCNGLLSKELYKICVMIDNGK